MESNTDEESNNRHDVEEADETIVLHGHQNHKQEEPHTRAVVLGQFLVLSLWLLTCSHSVSANKSMTVPTSRNSPEYLAYAQAQSASMAAPMTRLASAAKVLKPMKPVTPDTT